MIRRPASERRWILVEGCFAGALGLVALYFGITVPLPALHFFSAFFILWSVAFIASTRARLILSRFSHNAHHEDRPYETLALECDRVLKECRDKTARHLATTIHIQLRPEPTRIICLGGQPIQEWPIRSDNREIELYVAVIPINLFNNTGNHISAACIATASPLRNWEGKGIVVDQNIERLTQTALAACSRSIRDLTTEDLLNHDSRQRLIAHHSDRPYDTLTVEYERIFRECIEGMKNVPDSIQLRPRPEPTEILCLGGKPLQEVPLRNDSRNVRLYIAIIPVVAFDDSGDEASGACVATATPLSDWKGKGIVVDEDIEKLKEHARALGAKQQPEQPMT